VRAALAVTLCISSCRVAQSQECADYVDCALKVGVTADTAIYAYESGGSCWDTAQMAESCTAMCKSADAAFKAAGLAADAGCTFSE
jgi:hypothetical protein